MAQDRQFPSRIGAPGSINAYTLEGGFTPAFQHFLLTMPATDYSSATDRLHYFIGALETKAPAGTGGQPRQYAAAGRSVFRLDSGTVTDDLVNFQSTFDSFNDVVQGMVICDGPADGAPTSTTLGTSILLVTFGSGNPNPGSTSQVGCYYRVLSTDSSTPWNAATDTSGASQTHLTAWQIIKAGPDLYAATDAGIAGSLGEYRVSKCPSGLNPLLRTSWGNGIEVGTPEWIITGLAAIGNAPVVGKPDGLYYYDSQTRVYENVLKNFELVPHALNGKVTQSVTNGVVYTTHDGGAYIFDGVSVNEISPHKLWKMLGKDVPSSRITCVADRGDGIAMLPEIGYQTTQNAGLVVNKVTSAGAATSLTANVVDGSLATGGDVSSLAATSFIDVWATIPFEGVVMHVTRSANTTVAAVFGSVSYSSATDTFTAASGFIDGTRITGNATTATSGGSLSFVGFPPSASAGIVMATDVNFGSLQQAVTFNYSSGTDISTPMYGMRIAMSGAAFDASTEIDEIEIIPFRPGLPNEVLLTATTNYTPRHRAGLTQPVYLLKRKGTNTFVPSDTYTLDLYGGAWAMAWHAGRPGQASGAQNTGQGLVIWGRYRTAFISEGPTRSPVQDLYPQTVDVSSSKPAPTWRFLYDWDAGDRTQLKTINEITIDTLFLEPTDQWEVFFQHDQRDIKKVAYGKGGPVKFRPPSAPARVVNAWLVLSRGQQTNERAPQFLEPIRVDFDWDGDIQGVQDPARPTPLLT